MSLLETSFAWVCQTRMHAPANADVWDLRHSWPKRREQIKRQFVSGAYQLSPLQNNTGPDCPAFGWSAQDAVVLKAVTLALAEVLPVHIQCTHVRGNGGLKRAVRDVAYGLEQDPSKTAYVCRTDVKSFYASINHLTLLDQLAPFIQCPVVMSLVTQYLRRTHEDGGRFYDVTRGISAGCPLSPLIGAFHLYQLDRAISDKHPRCFYIRYMDDILILAPTRWQLRRAIATMNNELEALGLQQHPDKTTIGRAARGFDFLGYHYCAAGLTLAAKTIRNHRIKLHRLYEQYRHARTKAAYAQIDAAISTYTARWKSWVTGGLNVPVKLDEAYDAYD